MASAGKKETVKTLSDKVEKLTEQLKDYNLLKKKLHELEKKLESFETIKNQDKEERVLDGFKCKKCGKVFDSKNSLKGHFITSHPLEVKCTMCDKKFQRNCDLELHIKSLHKVPKSFECSKCDKTFVLSWRL